MPTHSRNTILLATDQQRSVLSALNKHRPHPLAYTPYGHRPRENGLLSLLGFNGELPDLKTGHYHLGKGYRQFNPVLMRFNSPDSWSPFGAGGLNAYGYCGGDPRNRRDPSGHFWGIKKFFRSLFKKTPTNSEAKKNSVSVVLASSDDGLISDQTPTTTPFSSFNTDDTFSPYNDSQEEMDIDFNLFEPKSPAEILRKAKPTSNEALDHVPIMSKHGQVKNYEVRDPEKLAQREIQRQIDQSRKEDSNKPDPRRFDYRSGGF